MPQFESQFFTSLIFWEVISFGILLWVLYKFAFPPILETLETRERKIRESLEQADRHRAEAERKMREYEVKISAASKEAEAVLIQAKEKAQQLLDENEQRLTADAERIKAEAMREIELERRKAIQDIRTHTTELALQIAEKVVSRSLREEDHRRLVEEALQAVGETFQQGQKG
jgi:F-type H+-transporting ATPase subunit b